VAGSQGRRKWSLGSGVQWVESTSLMYFRI
jgi:hypothetical protein